MRSTDLTVIARTSSFQFKGKNEDVRSIARRLTVTHLLEGSVRKEGQRLRITAQLIRASDGVYLWSEIYDRNLADIFKVQDEIAVKVSQALHAALGNGSQTASRQPGLVRTTWFWREDTSKDEGPSPMWKRPRSYTHRPSASILTTRRRGHAWRTHI